MGLQKLHIKSPIISKPLITRINRFHHPKLSTNISHYVQTFNYLPQPLFRSSQLQKLS